MRQAGRILVAAGLLLALGGAGFLAVRYRVYQVVGPSMAPILATGDRIVVDTEPGTIRVGDVVLLGSGAWPDGAAGERVKRVVALGGSTVVCCDPSGAIGVDDAWIGGPWTPEPPDAPRFRVTVPPGRMFVAGDNRALSVDSRTLVTGPEGGTVPADSVQGRVVAIALPAGRARVVGWEDGPYRAAVAAVVVGSLSVVAGGVARAVTALGARPRRPTRSSSRSRPESELDPR